MLTRYLTALCLATALCGPVMAQQAPSAPKATLEVTAEEGNALIQMIDIATKHPDKGGVQLAPAAAYWVDKLQKAFKAAEAPKPEPEKKP